MILATELKENNQDFEFYPTTMEIIDVMINDLKRHDNGFRYGETKSVLDIGAGNGKVLNVFKKMFSCQTLAIEKSEILIKKLVKDHMVIGTDFHEQSLINCSAEVVFCNPPYKEYEFWAEKIIKSIKADYLYLVIPSRWINSSRIKNALEFRNETAKVIQSFTFEDSEDRKARAKVDLLFINYRYTQDNLFEKFFCEKFGDFSEEIEKTQEEEDEKSQKKTELITSYGLIPALVKYYEEDLKNIHENYEKAASLDKKLLLDIGVSPKTIIHQLEEKLKSLRGEYWNELFSNLNSVTKRLTSSNRKDMLNSIEKYISMDFTEKNIYAVLCWMLEHANQYIDKQIIDIFNRLVEKCNIKNYKSNKKVFEDNKWRYSARPENISHIYLDYRLVVHNKGGMSKSDFSNYSFLSAYAKEFISDLLCIANNLKFDVDTSDPRLLESDYQQSKYWESGKSQEFFDSNGKVILEVKAFYNGNLHIRMNQKFALALNVAMGKLNGWIHTAKEATDELNNKDAGKYFDLQYHLNSPKQLLIGN